MTINDLTANKIKEIRNTVGFSAEAVANELGISKAAYSQLENGKTEITISKIEMLAKIFQVSMETIIPNISQNFTQISHGKNAVNAHTVHNLHVAENSEKVEEIIDLLNKLKESL